MFQEQDFEELSADGIKGKAAELKADGYRMVQICAVPQEGGSELVYSFDKDLKLKNYKVQVPGDGPVDSITQSFWSAFIYENEIHDLFGVEFTDMAVDYKGNFFRTGDKKTPWKAAGKKEGE